MADRSGQFWKKLLWVIYTHTQQIIGIIPGHMFYINLAKRITKAWKTNFGDEFGDDFGDYFGDDL